MVASRLVRAALGGLLLAGRGAEAADDGIQTLPAMGWSTWYATGGNLSEAVVLDVAERIVKTGLRDAGYVFVNLDDAWLAPTRDRFGAMVGDPHRFPNGIKALADKLHAMGLKLGLYGDPGIRTCMGYPGQFEHEYQDARTLAEWGVDFWKYDQCWHKIPLIDTLAFEAYSRELPASVSVSNGNSLGMNVRGMSAHGQDANFAGDRIKHFTDSNATGFVGPQISISAMPASWTVAETWNGADNEGGIPGTQIQYYEAYRLFGEALKSTGRNITYSICPFIAGCDKSIWSYYKNWSHMSMNQCPEHDATDSWSSFLWHVDDSQRNGVGEATGPGYFNDLDFLQIGYKALSDETSGGKPLMTDDEYRSEYSVFCLLAAPLIMSNDLSQWTPAMAATLLNKEMIAISQDPLAIAGKLVWNSSDGCVGNMCGHPYAGSTVDPQHCNGCQLNVNPNMYTVYARPLHDGAVAIGLLNRQRGPTPPPPPLPKGLTPFLKGKLCVDQGEILGSGGAASVDACFSACKTTAGCAYFGFTDGPPAWCIRYKACTARPTSDPSYTVYKMPAAAAAGGADDTVVGGAPPPPPLGGTNATHTISLDLSVIGVPKGQQVRVRDVWAGQEDAAVTGVISRDVCSHCTVVLKISLASGERIDFKPWR